MRALDTSGLDNAPARLSPHLLGLVGERFATAISAIQAQWLAGDHAAGQQALAEMERLGVRLQQVARMVSHEGAAPQEKVDLTEACGKLVVDWQGRADAARVLLQVDGAPLDVPVNAAALAQVLDLLVEHGVAVGSRLVLSVQYLGQPAQPSVQLEITRRQQPGYTAVSTPTEVDQLPVLLAALLARSSGLRLRQSAAGKLLTLVLSVPAMPLEVLPADQEAALPRTPVARGGRVLIVDPNSASRVQAHHLLHAAGMAVDAVDSVAQAHAALRDGEPDVLITGFPANDGELIELIDEIRGSFPGVRVIELVDAPNAFAFSMPGSDAPGRLSRDELEAHLAAAVSQEIYASKAG